PVGEHDTVVGLGGVAAGTVPGTSFDLGDQRSRSAPSVVHISRHHGVQLAFAGQRGRIGNEDVTLTGCGHGPLFDAESARLRAPARARSRLASSASASIAT